MGLARATRARTGDDTARGQRWHGQPATFALSCEAGNAMGSDRSVFSVWCGEH